MKILLIDNGSSYLSSLKKLIKPAKTLAWTDLTGNFNKFDLIILSGGHQIPIIGHGRTFGQEIKLIKQIKKPIIGICLGSELIAHLFGAQLRRMKHRDHGVRSVVENASGKTFRVYESHRWAITKLPKTLIELAKSEDGVEIFRHKTKPIFGLQFHPEMLVKKTDGRKLLRTILVGLGWK